MTECFIHSATASESPCNRRRTAISTIPSSAGGMRSSRFSVFTIGGRAAAEAAAVGAAGATAGAAADTGGAAGGAAVGTAAGTTGAAAAAARPFVVTATATATNQLHAHRCDASRNGPGTCTRSCEKSFWHVSPMA